MTDNLLALSVVVVRILVFVQIVILMSYIIFGASDTAIRDLTVSLIMSMAFLIAAVIGRNK